MASAAGFDFPRTPPAHVALAAAADQLQGCGSGEESDIHICLDSLERSLVFFNGIHAAQGPKLAVEHGFTASGLGAMGDVCEKIVRDDFMVQLNGRYFRGRRDRFAVDGHWIRLRQIRGPAPSLNDLPSPMPAVIRDMLVSPALSAGGIIYITGAPASGKSTTAAATVVSRLRELGGMCYTLEDPPEFPLNGWHGEGGYCSQTWVEGKTSKEWNDAFRGALRSQPAGTTLMMYIGEVRDSASALALFRAAASGFLVIATGFATDIPSGLDNLLRLSRVRRDSEGPLASLLRLVLHQRIEHGMLRAHFLASPVSHSPVANKIRAGHLPHLQNDLDKQATEALAGRHPFGQYT